MGARFEALFMSVLMAVSDLGCIFFVSYPLDLNNVYGCLRVNAWFGKYGESPACSAGILINFMNGQNGQVTLFFFRFSS